MRTFNCTPLLWRRFEEAVTRRIRSSVRQSSEPHVVGGRVSQVRHRSAGVPVPASPGCCRCCCRRQSIRLHAASAPWHDELCRRAQPPAGRTASCRSRDHTRRPGSDVIARYHVRTSIIIMRSFVLLYVSLLD